MASQTPYLETNGRSSRGMFGNAAEFVHDLVTLSELQVKLLILDLREGSRHAMLPIGLMIFGVALALGCFPILLAALGFGLIAAGLSSWLAFLLAGLIGIVISLATAVGGFLLLKKQAAVLQRSQREFNQNLLWIKTALTRKPQPSAYRPADSER